MRVRRLLVSVAALIVVMKAECSAQSSGFIRMTPAESRAYEQHPADEFAPAPPSADPSAEPARIPKREALFRASRTLQRLLVCLEESGEVVLSQEIMIREFLLQWKIAFGEIIETNRRVGGATTHPSTRNPQTGDVTVESDPWSGGSDSRRTICLPGPNWNPPGDPPQPDAPAQFNAGLWRNEDFPRDLLGNTNVTDMILALTLNHEVGHCIRDDVGASSSNPAANKCSNARNEIRILQTDLALMSFLRQHPGCFADPILPNFYKEFENELKKYLAAMEKLRDDNC